MTFQIIRKDGRIRGLSLMFGDGRVLSGVGDRAEYWRICDHCAVGEAIVFCRTHAQYVCSECLSGHGRTALGRFVLGYACEVMSMSVARELMTTALIQVEETRI